MLLLNSHPDYKTLLTSADRACLDETAADDAEAFFRQRADYQPTPLLAFPTLARKLGLAAIHVKDESKRLGLDSFKALGGEYAVVRLVLEEASRILQRTVPVAELHTPQVCAIAATMTVACATDGNHGRSVACGARRTGARARIFVHQGVSERRIAAIASFGAEIVQVAGTYDDAVAEASRACAADSWQLVADTSWPGYERVPGIIMQGYTVLLREAWRTLAQAPTHVFMQAGVGGLAASIAGHLAIVLGEQRPVFVVVEPARAACLLESIRAGRRLKIDKANSTVMAMLECYEPSLVAWRILSRTADAFMTVSEDEAVSIMKRLARPGSADPSLVAGESGGVGLAGLIRLAGNAEMRAAIGLNAASRVLLVNTEGATDPVLYEALVGIALSNP